MKKTLHFNLVIGLVAVTALFLGLSVLDGATSHAVGNPHRVIVVFEGDAVNESARDALENMGGKVVKDLPLVNGLVVLLPEQTMAHRVEALADVKRVDPDVRVFALAPPGACSPWPGCRDDEPEDPVDPPIEPTETLEWGVDRIDAELAWGTSTGYGIKVAVLDTGIDNNHADLVGNIAGGINFVPKNSARPVDPNNWDDDNGHGTHVAGIVAATDNEIGVVGVAPQASLYGVKVLDRRGSGYLSYVIAGIEWAVVNEMDVINMSLGTTSDVPSLQDAVDAAYNAGVVVVAAAGNSGDGNSETNEVIYPAKYESVIAVAATASDDSTPYWSSEGVEVEIAAPGVDIRSTWNDGTYNTISGTSMASPHVAGTVALMLGSGISSADVRTILQTTSDDLGGVGFDNFYGYGLIDAEENVTGIETN